VLSARNISGTTIAEASSRNPEIYSSARHCISVLPRVRQRLQVALRTLGRLYPEARFPPVTIAVGRGKPVGVGSSTNGVQIGLEALCATNYLNPNVEDRFVHVIAHEYAHVQQVPALVDDENATVLEGSLNEGAAEFTAAEDATDRSKWLNNGTPEKPGDLGYWVGYRIVEAYYQQATDKRQALREILELTDSKAFLAKSGWYPGMQLK
jgi:hypothetical protein